MPFRGYGDETQPTYPLSSFAFIFFHMIYHRGVSLNHLSSIEMRGQVISSQFRGPETEDEEFCKILKMLKKTR